MMKFDFLPVEEFYDEIVGSNDIEPTPELANVGYETPSIIRNMGSIGVILVFLYLTIFIIAILGLTVRKNRGACCVCFPKCLGKLKDNFNLKGLLMFSHNNFLMFTMSAVIYLYYRLDNGYFTQTSYKVDFVLTLVTII